MFRLKSLSHFLRNPNSRKKIVVFLWCIVVYRIGSLIPLPGIHVTNWQKYFTGLHGTILDYLDFFGGGGLQNSSVLALGIYSFLIGGIFSGILISPYNNYFKEMYTRESDLRTRYKQLNLTLSLIIAFGFGIAVAFWFRQKSMATIWSGDMLHSVVVAVTIVGGAAFTFFIAETMEEHLGNNWGLSTLIWSGVLVRTFDSIKNQIATPDFLWKLGMFALVFSLGIYFLIRVNGLRRNIPLIYPGRRIGIKKSDLVKGSMPIVIHLEQVGIALHFYFFIFLTGRLLINHLNFPYKLILSNFLSLSSIGIAVILFYFISSAFYLNSDPASGLYKAGAQIPGVPQSNAANYLAVVNNRIQSVGVILILSLIGLTHLVNNLGFPIPFLGSILVTLIPSAITEMVIVIEADLKLAQVLHATPSTIQTSIKIKGKPSAKQDIRKDIEKQYKFGNLAYDAKQYPAAKHYYDTAINLNANHREYLPEKTFQEMSLKLGAIANREQDFATAMKHLEPLVNKDYSEPTQLDLLYELGIAHAGLQELDSAQEYLMQGFRLSDSIPGYKVIFKQALENVLRQQPRGQLPTPLSPIRIINNNLLPNELNTVEIEVKLTNKAVVIKIMPMEEYLIPSKYSFDVGPGSIPTKVQFEIFPIQIGMIRLIVSYNEELFALPILVRSRNPYQRGKIIYDERMFFGRASEVDTIRYGIQKDSPDNYLIVGRRRIGKSSLLVQIPRMIRYPLIPVLIDLQQIGERTHLSLLRTIILETCQKLDELDKTLLHGITLKITTIDTDKIDIINQAFSGDIKSLFKLLDDHHFIDSQLVFLIDEADLLLEIPQANSTLQFIRSVLQRPRVSAVMAGTHKFLDLEMDPTSPLHNIFVTISLGGLSLIDSQKLIEEPVKSFGINYSSEAVKAIIDYGGTNPYYLQYICFDCIEQIERTRQSQVSRAVVEKIINKVLDDRGLQNQYQAIWDSLSEQERNILGKIVKDGTLLSTDFMVEDRFSMDRLANLNILKKQTKKLCFDSGLEHKWTTLLQGE